MSAETKDSGGKLGAVSPASLAVPTPFLSPWLAFLAAGFCFIAGGFRLTADEVYCYESMNVELPTILEIQVEWGARLGLAFIAAGLSFLLLTRWYPRVRATAAGRRLQDGARAIAIFGALAAVLVSVTILYSGDVIFMKLQASLQQ